MNVESSLVIKTRGGGILHVIALATFLSDSEAIEKEWDMIEKAVTFIRGGADYNEMCKMQEDLREKQISLFGDYVLEIAKTTLI